MQIKENDPSFFDYGILLDGRKMIGAIAADNEEGWVEVPDFAGTELLKEGVAKASDEKDFVQTNEGWDEVYKVALPGIAQPSKPNVKRLYGEVKFVELQHTNESS